MNLMTVISDTLCTFVSALKEILHDQEDAEVNLGASSHSPLSAFESTINSEPLIVLVSS